MPINPRALKSDTILLLTAIIWGFAFVAQRAGMAHVGPFTYNAIRFALGSLALAPFALLSDRKNLHPQTASSVSPRLLLLGGLAVGVILFLGSSLQQIGLVYTTAGKAGFITGMYVVMVPIFGLIWKFRIGPAAWLGAILAAIGLYFLSMTKDLRMEPGDLWVLVGGAMWAGHVLLIGYLSPKVNPLKLALIQFIVCSILSFACWAIFESTAIHSIMLAGIPILYGGFMSVAIAFTLQVVGQRYAPPSHAAIIMSFEAVFAAIGGVLILHEILSPRAILGCALMLAGMLSSQLGVYK